MNTGGIKISMQYFASETTKISDLIDPEVMADMISAKIPDKIVVAPFAKVDKTLSGVPGDTITIPQYSYIGDAVDVAEGVAAETVKLQTSTTTAKVKKAMKAVELTDEAVLSGYGNPVAETNNQLAALSPLRWTATLWTHFRRRSLSTTAQRLRSNTPGSWTL